MTRFAHLKQYAFKQEKKCPLIGIFQSKKI